MKSLLLSIGVVAMFAMVSCSKEKTCECVSKYSGYDATYASLYKDVTTTVTTKEECSDGNSSMTTSGVTVKTTCTEK